MVTEQKQNIINKYLGGQGIWSISKENNLNRNTIKNILNENNIRIRKHEEYNYRIYPLNENCLDQIDSEIKAYFLGFFFADGCNYYDHYLKNIKYKIRIQIQSNDDYLLDIFNKHLFYTTKPILKIKNKNQSVFELQSKILSTRLYELGAISKKTYNLSFPIIEEKYYHHFIRGYFDGDGFISDYPYKKQGRQRMSIVGCKDIIKYIQDIFINNIGLNPNKLMKNNKQEYLRILEYGGDKNMIKIYNYLYKDSTIFLERKKQRFEKILNKNLQEKQTLI